MATLLHAGIKKKNTSHPFKSVSICGPVSSHPGEFYCQTTMKIVAERARPSSDTPTLLPRTHSAQNQQLDRMKMHSINLPAPTGCIFTQAARSTYIFSRCARRSAKVAAEGATSIRAPADRASPQPPVRHTAYSNTASAHKTSRARGADRRRATLRWEGRPQQSTRAAAPRRSWISLERGAAPLLTVAATMLPRCRSS